MDSLSILGFLVAIFAIVLGQSLDGGHLEALLNVPALIIVLGGTCGAVMLETPNLILKRAIKLSQWVLIPPKVSFKKAINEVVYWSTVSRKEGFLGLENVLIDTSIHPFAKKALQLIVDGSDPKMIRDILTVELENKESQDLQAANVFESMGGYAPTIGILGAVLGLIHVLGNLAEPNLLGPGIAVAFVATIYGVGFANLLFIPVSKKIKNLILAESLYRELIIEGAASICDGENPRVIEMKLKGFLD